MATGKEQFSKCEICGSPLQKVEFDSPLYCDRCIADMERKDLSPEQLKVLRQQKKR